MRILGQLKQMATSSEGGARLSEWKDQLSPVVTMWKQMLQDNKDLLQPLGEMDDPALAPVDSFVVMEVTGARALVSLVDSGLSGIHEFVMGRALMSAELHQLGSCLLRGQVPQSWDARWEGPDNPLAWMRLLVRKAVALNDWLRRSKERTLLGRPLSLNDLFRPATFVDALRQQAARAVHRALDTLKLVALWGSSSSASTAASGKGLAGGALPPVHASIDGLLLQGCSFDAGKLVEAQPSAPELIQMPRCTLAWIPEEAPSPYGSDVVDVPVYQNLLREKIVVTLSVPCSGSKQKWNVAGVALFLAEE